VVDIICLLVEIGLSDMSKIGFVSGEGHGPPALTALPLNVKLVLIR
jgi:hypothetical protein